MGLSDYSVTGASPPVLPRSLKIKEQYELLRAVLAPSFERIAWPNFYTTFFRTTTTKNYNNTSKISDCLKKHDHYKMVQPSLDKCKDKTTLKNNLDAPRNALLLQVFNIVNSNI